MLKFMRKKMISIYRKDQDTLSVHGILDDDIYSLELDLDISLADLEILSIRGKWNRWTTPECRRSDQFLQEAVGFRNEEGLSQKVHKIIGRKSCRHYANLLLECWHSAREAALVAQWEAAKADRPDLAFEDFLAGKPASLSEVRTEVTGPRIEVSEGPKPKTKEIKILHEKARGGTLIDLHVHTSPASPCSSASVDALIEEAKRIGLDGICLTDHNYVWSASEVENLRRKHGFLILRGNEITTDQGDMLVFGLDNDIKGIVKLDDLRGKVEQAGGFMIVAHPFRGFLVVGATQIGLTPERAMERPLLKLVDAIEILNGKVTERENKFAAEVAAGLNLPVTGGSDAHEVDEVGQYATQFFQEIKNEEDLVAALRSGNYAPVVYRK